MVTEAIVMWVRTSATSIKPHQGRSSKPWNSIRCLCYVVFADGPSGFYANRPLLYLEKWSTCYTIAHLFRAVALQHPNLSLRKGNFDPPGAEFRQQAEAD